MRRHNRCSRLWRCGLALVVLWAVSGCSTSQIQDISTPESERSPCNTCTQNTSSASTDSTLTGAENTSTPEKEAEPLTAEQSSTTPPENMPDSNTPAENANNHSSVTVKEIKDLSSSTKQTVEQSQTAEETPPQVPTTAAQAPKASEPIKQYTVQGGENLYTIANQPSIYAEGMLWPLIYRANRDQIKDPRQIYPGQTLNIPRDISETDKEQARTKAKESSIFTHEETHTQNPATNK